MFEGSPIVIGGKTYIFADINLKTIKRIFPCIEALSKPTDSPAFLNAITTIVAAGLQRNYPEITEDMVDEQIAYYEIPDILEVITQQITKKKNQGTSTQTLSPSTGEISTQESLPPQDGPGSI